MTTTQQPPQPTPTAVLEDWQMICSECGNVEGETASGICEGCLAIAFWEEFNARVTCTFSPALLPATEGQQP